MRVIAVYPDDDGPVDAEHIDVAVKVRDEGWTLKQVNEALRQCHRPAKAFWHVGETQPYKPPRRKKK